MTYDLSKDSYMSWRYCLQIMRLSAGLRRFETVLEMYMIEAWGGIP